jgi:hypothetical protein
MTTDEVLDALGRDATLKREGNARGFIHPEFDGGKEAVRLIVREKGYASSGG